MPRNRPPETSFRQLFDAHHDAVARFCLRRVRSEDADDVVASVFLVAWRKIDQAPTGEFALAWLYRIAHLEMSTMRRSARRWDQLKARVSGLAEPEPPTVEADTMRQIDRDLVVAALHRLSSADRDVVLLRSYEELPIAEIAIVLGCSAAAAAKRLTRALERLRQDVLSQQSVEVSAPSAHVGVKES